MRYTVYAREDDMTFIMEEKKTETTKSIKVIGFYYGEPDEKNTELFSYRNCAKVEV